MMVNCPVKIKSKDQTILDIFYAKDSSNLMSRVNFRLKLKTQIIKLLEISESICYFYGCLPIRKNSTS